MQLYLELVDVMLREELEGAETGEPAELSPVMLRTLSVTGIVEEPPTPGSLLPPQIVGLIPFDGEWRFDYSLFGPPAANWKEIGFDEDVAFWPGPNRVCSTGGSPTSSPPR